MPERDGYIPGVPCWVDTSQPDPEAALPFYSGLFGWEFADVMPEGSEGKYFIGRIRGGDVAAVGSIPDGAPPLPMWNTYIWVDSADADGDHGRGCRRRSGDGAVRRAWTRAGWRSSPIPRAPRSASGRPRTTRARRWSTSTARSTSTASPPETPSAAKAFYGAVFGWQTLALAAGRDVDAARLRRPPRGAHPRPSQAAGADGRARRLHRRRRRRSTRSPTTTPRRRRIGTSRSPSTTPRPPRPRRGSSAARSSPDRSTLRGRGLAVIKDPQGATFIASQFVPENKDLEA